MMKTHCTVPQPASRLVGYNKLGVLEQKPLVAAVCRDNKKMFWQQGLFLLSLLTFILIRKHPTQLLLGRAEKDEDPARIF